MKKESVWVIFIAFLAMISAAGACEECHERTVSVGGDIINTSDSDVIGNFRSIQYWGGVEVVNCGHNLGVPLMYVNFTEPSLTTGQVDSGLMVDGWQDVMLIYDAKSRVIGTSDEPIFVFTDGKKLLSGEQEVRVVPAENGTTTYYDEIGIEVFQSIYYPHLRIRAINGGDITVVGAVDLKGLKEILVLGLSI